jgi:hypothetical protein
LELLELGLEMQGLVLPVIPAGLQVADSDLERLDVLAALRGLVLPAVAREAKRASQGAFGRAKRRPMGAAIRMLPPVEAGAEVRGNEPIQGETPGQGQPDAEACAPETRTVWI